jgi:hypothetical protein
LFRKEFQTIDVDTALAEAFEVLGELIAMRSIADEFNAAQQAAIQKAEVKGRIQSLPLPAVGNVRAHCKSFAQKADHCAAAILRIVRLFYPKMKKKNWDEFRELIKGEFGQDDDFFKLMDAATPILQLVRNTRDCLDHHNKTGAVPYDFELDVDGKIGVPSIEVNFRESTIERCSIVEFMRGTLDRLLDIFELMIVHMCAKNVQPFSGMPMTIAALSDEYRKAWRVKYAYGTFYADGRFVPCG